MNINLPTKIFSDHGLNRYLEKGIARNLDIQLKNNNYFNICCGSIDTSSTIGQIIALFQIAVISLESAFMYGILNSHIETAKENIDWANRIKEENNSDLVYKKVFELYTKGQIHVVENNKLYKRSLEAFIASIAVVAFGALMGSGVLTILGIVSGVATSVFGGYHFAYHCTDYSNITKQLKEVIDLNKNKITLQAA